MWTCSLRWQPAVSLSLATFTFLALYVIYGFKVQNDSCLSPQGCKMSYMSPSYILQSDFNTSWTPLAKRYSLWLYREVGWDNEKPTGSPVLFVPGNAGSSHQVRSIASSATRQYYSSPHVRSQELLNLNISTVDFFAVEFNEDLSAMHGGTLLSQQKYIQAALEYITSLYQKHTKVLVIGHSMGGPVALSLLPSDLISAIITMSSPNSLPPARFDSEIETFYKTFHASLFQPSQTPAQTGAFTPVLSVCGGSPDSLIPSETCHLPMPPDQESIRPYRETVFTSSMEGTWTGVGHQEMVWCHQVRWRVARAALEMTAASTVAQREAVLDKWFRGLPHGTSRNIVDPPLWFDSTNMSLVTQLPPNSPFRLPSSSDSQSRPNGQTHIYLLPSPKPSTNSPARLVLRLSRGNVRTAMGQPPIGSTSAKFQVKLHSCHSEVVGSISCQPWSNLDLHRVSKPLPIPRRGKPFPEPKEGSNDADIGVILETTLGSLSTPLHRDGLVGIQVEGLPQSGISDLVVMIESLKEFDGARSLEVREISTFDLLRGVAHVELAPPDATSGPLIQKVRLPTVLANSLLVYKTEAKMIGNCEDNATPPMLQSFSPPYESHFHVLTSPSYLHTHATGPFVSQGRSPHTISFEIYSNGICFVPSISIGLDIRASLGRMAVRYWGVPLIWGLGVFLISFALSWYRWENGATFAPPRASIFLFVWLVMPSLIGLLLLLSAIPLPPSYLLGNSGELMLAPLSAITVVLGAGFVIAMSYLLDGLAWVASMIVKPFKLKRSEAGALGVRPKLTKRNLTSMLSLLMVVWFLIPYQVTFIATFLIQLHTCASGTPVPERSATVLMTNGSDLQPSELSPSLRLGDSPGLRSRNLSRRNSPSQEEVATETGNPPAQQEQDWPLSLASTTNINYHLLLLQFLLLPFTGPGLAAWIRTMATAGYSRPPPWTVNQSLTCFWLGVVYTGSSAVPWTRIGGLHVRFSPVTVLLGCWGIAAFMQGMRNSYILFEIGTVFAVIISARSTLTGTH